MGLAACAWPCVQGTVLEVRFDETEVYDCDGNDDVFYRAQMRYEYRVHGRRYVSRHFTWRPTRGLPQTLAYSLLAGIRRGQQIDVHVDPRQPARAVVLPGIDGGNRARLGLSILALIGSLIWAAS